MNDTIYQALTLIIPLVIAIVFHEVAHGYVAKLLGDPTAQERGRLTLNPLRHVDPIGTIVVPGLLALFHMPVFGWAKPVPVIPQRMRNPRLGMLLSAAAGPASNLVQAAVAAVLLGVWLRGHGSSMRTLDDVMSAIRSLPPIPAFLGESLLFYLRINIFLALFNLLPIPPFDGSHIVEGLMPRGAARIYGRAGQQGMLLVILVIVVLPWLFPGFDPIGRIIMPPFEWLAERYFDLAVAVAGH